MASSRVADWRGIAGRFLHGLAVLLIVAGCSPRDHDNLFDPENPDTGGNPDVFVAVAGDGFVSLRWDFPQYDDLLYFDIARTGTAGEVLVAENLSPGLRAFTDSTAVNEVTYTYRLRTFFAGAPGPVESPASTATPGGRVVWILDQRFNGPTLIAPDGRSVKDRPGSSKPSDISVHPASGRVAAVDFFEQRVDVFDRNSNLVATTPLDMSPLTAAFDPDDATLWIAGFDPSDLRHLSDSLNTVLSADTGMGIPEDVAFDAARGDVWLADSDGRLIHRRPDGSLATIEGFARPFSVAIETGTGDAWLVDRLTGVYRVDAAADTVLWLNTEFIAPFEVLADGQGGAWVTDSAAGRIVRLDAAGAVAAVIEELPTPAGIALDPATGDLWVTDLGPGELVRLTTGGLVVSRLPGLSRPFAVQVADP